MIWPSGSRGFIGCQNMMLAVPIHIFARQDSGRSASAICASQTIHLSPIMRLKSIWPKISKRRSGPLCGIARYWRRSQRRVLRPLLISRSISAPVGCRRQHCGAGLINAAGLRQLLSLAGGCTAVVKFCPDSSCDAERNRDFCCSISLRKMCSITSVSAMRTKEDILVDR